MEGRAAVEQSRMKLHVSDSQTEMPVPVVATTFVAAGRDFPPDTRDCASPAGARIWRQDCVSFSLPSGRAPDSIQEN